jgi:bifunctional polynucleotide phosphatase/kinase
MGPKRKTAPAETPSKRTKKEVTATPKASKKVSAKKSAVSQKTPSTKTTKSKQKTLAKETEEVETKCEQTQGAEIAWDWVGGRKGKNTLLVGGVGDGSNRPVTKIMGFDVDGTLIETKSGATFAKNKSDWKWKFDSVVSRIQQFWKDGFHIVFFTNQGGVQGEGRATTKAQEAARVEALCGRLGAIAVSLGVPVLVLAATASDLYRKPLTGMWNVMIERLQTTQKAPLAISLANCVFVGDAAGRPKGWTKGVPADFSCTDRKFARNVGISFQTPEECFELAAPVPLTKIDWGENPADWISTDEERAAIDKSNGEKIAQMTSGPEVVICVGMPGAGKSSACKGRLTEHVWINQDTLGTADRCAREVRSNLNEGKSVVVDCTNPSVDHRRMYIRIATEKKASARVLYFNTPRHIAEHLNILREVTSKGERARVPQIAYRHYLGQFECPSKELDKVLVSTIEFCPIFATPKDREVFCAFTS